jgi:hypothetical protein
MRSRDLPNRAERFSRGSAARNPVAHAQGLYEARRHTESRRGMDRGEVAVDPTRFVCPAASRYSMARMSGTENFSSTSYTCGSLPAPSALSTSAFRR